MLIYGHNYPIHEISFARRVLGYSSLKLCFYPIAVMFYAPLLLYSHCGFIPSGVCVNFSVYGSFPMEYGVCQCINTKSLPTDFHWSMGRLLHTIVMYGVMVVCIVGIVFYLLAYIIIIQSGGGKSNKKKCVLIFFNIFFLYLTETIL